MTKNVISKWTAAKRNSSKIVFPIFLYLLYLLCTCIVFGVFSFRVGPHLQTFLKKRYKGTYKCINFQKRSSSFHNFFVIQSQRKIVPVGNEIELLNFCDVNSFQQRILKWFGNIIQNIRLITKLMNNRQEIEE